MDDKTDLKAARKAAPATYSAPALEKGFNVIELLATAPDGLTISEIAARLGHRSISEIFRIIVVMERRGWVARQKGTDRVQVTYKVLELAFAATPARALVHVAAPLMHEMATELDQSSHLVVMHQHKGLVIHRQENPGPTGFMVRQGQEVDLLNSCSGMVLMAFSDDSTLEAILEAHPDMQDNGPEALRTRLLTIREQGYVLKPSTRTLGVTDISCPVFGRHGQLLAALTVPFLQLIDGTQLIQRDEARQKLQDYAARISQSLGGQSLESQTSGTVHL